MKYKIKVPVEFQATQITRHMIENKLAEGWLMKYCPVFHKEVIEFWLNDYASIYAQEGDYIGVYHGQLCCWFKEVFEQTFAKSE